MQINVTGTAQMKQMQQQFAAVTAEIDAMNAALVKSTQIPTGTPAQFRKISGYAQEASRWYDSALASSGAFKVQQFAINDAVAQNTEALQKNKLSFREVFGK